MIAGASTCVYYGRLIYAKMRRKNQKKSKEALPIKKILWGKVLESSPMGGQYESDPTTPPCSREILFSSEQFLNHDNITHD